MTSSHRPLPQSYFSSPSTTFWEKLYFILHDRILICWLTAVVVFLSSILYQYTASSQATDLHKALGQIERLQATTASQRAAIASLELQLSNQRKQLQGLLEPPVRSTP